MLAALILRPMMFGSEDTPMSNHLAQVNIARMRGAFTDPVMAGLVARVEEMNALAKAVRDLSGGCAERTSRMRICVCSTATSFRLSLLVFSTICPFGRALTT